MGLMGIFGKSAAQELAEKQAAELAARTAATNAAKDAQVTALRSELAVTADSPTSKILDSYNRSNELVYSNGSNYGPTNQSQAVSALLNKEIYGDKRWEIFPEEEYTKISGQMNSETVQTLFRTRSATSSDVDLDITHSLIAPMSPQKVINAAYGGRGVVIHDKVSHTRLPASNFSEIMSAAKSMLGIK